MRFMGRLQDNPLFAFGVSAAIAAALGRDLLPIGSNAGIASMIASGTSWSA
jgi:hypothetical protein